MPVQVTLPTILSIKRKEILNSKYILTTEQQFIVLQNLIIKDILFHQMDLLLLNNRAVLKKLNGNTLYLPKLLDALSANGERDTQNVSIAKARHSRGGVALKR